jgi:hypothetical protein
MTWGPTTLPEWIFTISTIAGIGITIFTFLDAIRVLNYLDALIRANHLSPRELEDHELQRWTAVSYVWDEVGRLTIHLFGFTVGVVALQTRPSDPDRPVSLLGALVAAYVIYNSVVLVAKSIKTMAIRAKQLSRLVQRAIEDGKYPTNPGRRLDVRPTQ